MSRRKQSNPKPLKREDEEDSQPSETTVKPSESLSVSCSLSSSSSSSSTSSSSSSSSSLSSSSSSSSSPSSSSPLPKVKIVGSSVTSNTSGTSPAAAPAATTVTATANSPPIPPHSPQGSGCESPVPRLRLNTSLATDPALRSDVMTVKTEKTGKDAEVVAVRGPAVEFDYLPSVPSTFQHVLASSIGLFPSSQIIDADAANLPKTKSQESPALVIENRPVPVFMCTPCGIRFSSASTLEAHQTYYCSHRLQVKGRTESEGEDPKSPQNGNEDGETSTKVLRTGKQYGCPHCSYSADKKVSLNRHMRMHSSSPAVQPPIPVPVPVVLPINLQNGEESPVANSPQTVDRYCQDCDIRFYSVKTLKAHKMHYCSSRYTKSSHAVKDSSTPDSPTDFQKISPEPQVQGRPRRATEQSFLLLRTNPILIVPYALLQSASVFTGSSPNFPSQDTPCILMPNGTVQPMSILVSNLSNEKDLSKNSNYSLKFCSKSKEETLSGKTHKSKTETAPLDLSVRRSSENADLIIDMEDEKENVYRSSPRLEDVRSPQANATTDERKSQSDCCSGTSSPNLSPSPHAKKSPRRTPNGIATARTDGGKTKEGKRAHDSDFSDCFGVEHMAKRNSSAGPRLAGPTLPLPAQLPLGLPGTASEFLGQVSLLPLLGAELRLPRLIGAQAVNEPSIPQVLVKQGVSKCQECNIVFCKHENYIAHKKHYCSARLPDLSSDENSRTSPAISRSPGTGNGNVKESSVENLKGQCGSPSAIKPQTMQYQFICVACSISFTSLDNLTTHQTFYCNKRPSESIKSTEEKNRKCAKCKAVTNGDHQCVGSCLNSPGSGWKCPCCEVVSPTAAAAQKHMDTHQGVRAFRCTICKYKGNTLRGMRTHIRMHFDKKSNDFQEEKFIGCILDEENESQSHQLQRLQQKQQQSQSNGTLDSRVSQVAVKVESGAEDEFVEVDVVEPPVSVPVAAGESRTPDPEDPPPPQLPINNVRKINYCETCDISFNFSSSLIAHKKFYCSATCVEPENQPKSSRTTPEAPVL